MANGAPGYTPVRPEALARGVGQAPGLQHDRMLIYSLVDYNPERDGDQEAWAAALAEQG